MNRLRPGFTLVEFILYLFMVGGLLTAAAAILTSILQYQAKLESAREVDQNLRFVTGRITQAVRNANSITVPTGGATSSRLTIVTPVASTNPTVFLSQSGTLYLKEGADATTTLNNTAVFVEAIFRNLTPTGTSGIIQVMTTVSTSGTTLASEFRFSQMATSSAAIRYRP